MPDANRSEQLDELVEALLDGGQPPPGSSRELADLVRIADDLRGLPREQFRAGLGADLERSTTMTTTVHHIPQGLGSVTPYLIVRDAAAALSLYEHVFGATEVMRHAEQGRVVHAKLRIGDSTIEMGEHRDVEVHDPETLPQVGMHLYVEDVDAVVARAAAAGVRVVRPVEEQPYGDREASLADPYGIVWFVATHVRDG